MNGFEIRKLMRGCRAAALATALRDNEKWPYASFVTVACDIDASPILLLSDLSDHSKNLTEDARASLLFDDARHLANPQEGSRVSVCGIIMRSTNLRCIDRFLGRHPEAALYAGFGDFHAYRMHVTKGHAVGGFAKAAWFDGQQLVLDEGICQAFAEEHDVTVKSLNENCGAEISHLVGGDDPCTTTWQVIGLDPDGLDLVDGSNTERITFAKWLRAPSEAGDALRTLCRPASG
jgi:putative heme iron utilization protein